MHHIKPLIHIKRTAKTPISHYNTGKIILVLVVDKTDEKTNFYFLCFLFQENKMFISESVDLRAFNLGSLKRSKR
jgi:hypothetical protein